MGGSEQGSTSKQPASIKAPDGSEIGIDQLDWSKRPDGLMPVVIQDAISKRVLMEAYVSPETLKETAECGKVVFQSRTRGRWMKGETSGNYLLLDTNEPIRCDCDRDCLLILVNPIGPTCHTGITSCFGENDPPSVSDYAGLAKMEMVIWQRKDEMPEGSYTTKLFRAGILKIAQKVGEEGVELALAAVGESDERVKEECADLFYHVTVMLCARGIKLAEVFDILAQRNNPKPPPAAEIRPAA